jgi:signal transduction histidine kinase
MEGIDKEWIELKPKRKVNFTNLSPGKYVFKLKAAINGHWNKYQKNLIIIIRPPWWETTWAYIIYTFCIVSVIYFVLRYYQIHLNDKKEKEIYESKIDFFTNIAHEILTPLTLIKGPIENLMQQIKSHPKIKEDVVLLEKSSDRLIKLVSQILDFRKIETKGFELEFKEVNIKTLLNEAFYTFEELAKRKKIKYQIECSPSNIISINDEEVLSKIFSNLFNNAIKYANKKTSIRLLNSFENQTFTIEFENDGLKIPLEMRDKIFEPFYRLKETKKQQGTGIGLSLTKTLTNLLKGKIYVKETSDNLTVFVLTLPLRP